MGRRKTVILSNFLIIILSFAQMWTNLTWILAMRYCFGIVVGFTLGSAPKILIEAVPAHLIEYGFGSSTNLFTFISVALLLLLGINNGSQIH